MPLQAASAPAHFASRPTQPIEATSIEDGHCVNSFGHVASSPSHTLADWKLSMEFKDALTLLISIAAFCVSMAVLFINRKKDRVIQTYVFLNEWRSPEFHAITLYIRGDFKKSLDLTKISGGFRGLKDEEAKRLRTVTHFLDYLGRALESGLLHEAVLLTTIGDPVIELWRILGPLIISERNMKKAERFHQGLPLEGYRQVWQSGFEHLAERARNFLHKHRIKELSFKGELYSPQSS
jgi:hypothetical protein